MGRHLPWPAEGGSSDDFIGGFTREEMVANIALHVQLNKNEQCDYWHIRGIVEHVRSKFLAIVHSADDPAEIVEKLHEMLCPDSARIFMAKIHDLLTDPSVDHWRKLGLFRIALLKMCQEVDVDLPALLTKNTSAEIVEGLVRATKNRAELS